MSKKAEEVDSGSDWDSLPGDVPEPSSSPDVTPRHQPAPPPDSPKGRVPQKRPQIKTQAVIATPEKTSPTNSPATQSSTKQGTPSSHRLSQLYGKPGITNFVDQSIVSATNFNDSGLESRQNKELNPDINENRLKQDSQGRRQDGIHFEMNEVDYHQRDPPFIDFQVPPSKEDTTKHMQSEKSKRGKVKSSYLAVTKTQNGNQSWDSDSDQEEEPVSHSRQHLTPRQKNNLQMANHEQTNTDHETVTEWNDQSLSLQTCCVPLDTEKQITGCSYHFDHGHNHHLDVRPEWREAYMKRIADRSEKWLHYFWQEFFSTIRIVTDFVFIFVLELLRFTFHYVLLRLLGGIVVVIGDHFLKPYLALLFNSVIQPSFIFTRNVLIGVRNLLQPLVDISSTFIGQLGSLLRAFRLFELNWKPVYERGQKRDVHVL